MTVSDKSRKKQSEDSGRRKKGVPISDVFIDIRASLISYISQFFKHQPATVEDVVQESYIRALEAQKRSDIRNPQAYLYRTSRNLALKTLQKSMNRLTDHVEEKELEKVAVNTIESEQECLAGERFEFFCRAVRLLPVKCRRVYVLRKVYGYSQKEIAHHLQISEKTVEAHIAKASVHCLNFMDLKENPAHGSRTRTRKQI